MAPPTHQQHPGSPAKHLIPLRHLQRALQRLPLTGSELLLRALVRRSCRTPRVCTGPQGPEPPIKSAAFILTPRSRHRLRMGRSRHQGGTALRVSRNGPNPIRETEEPRGSKNQGSRAARPRPDPALRLPACVWARPRSEFGFRSGRGVL